MDTELILDTQAHEKHNDKGIAPEKKPTRRSLCTLALARSSAPRAGAEDTSNPRTERRGIYQGDCSRNFAPFAPQSRSAFDLLRFKSVADEEAPALLEAFNSSSSVR